MFIICTKQCLLSDPPGATPKSKPLTSRKSETSLVNYQRTKDAARRGFDDDVTVEPEPCVKRSNGDPDDSTSDSDDVSDAGSAGTYTLGLDDDDDNADVEEERRNIGQAFKVATG